MKYNIQKPEEQNTTYKDNVIGNNNLIKPSSNKLSQFQLDNINAKKRSDDY